MKLIVFLAFLFFTNPKLDHIDKDLEKVQFIGTVIEDLTGEPIPGVSVFIKEFNKEIFTDFDGNFTIEDLIPGTYNLEINFVSFEKKELNSLKITNEHHSLLIRLN